MFDLKTLMVILTSVESYLKDNPNKSMNKYLSSGPSFKLDFGNNLGLAKLLGNLIHWFDLACVAGLFLALIWMIRSTLGNNGESRAKGVRTPMWIYLSFLLVHLIILALFSYTPLSGTQIINLVVFIVSEGILMFGSVFLFSLGTFYSELYIMTKQPQAQRNAQTNYRFMIISLGAVGALSILVLII